MISNFTGRCIFRQWKLNYTEIQENNNEDYYYYIFDNRKFCQKVPKIAKKSPEKLKNTLFGPIGVPANWQKFPQRGYCLERNWEGTLDMMGYYIVHSARVRDHLIQKSKTFAKKHKYGVMRACSNMKIINVKSYEERQIDFLYYEKYMDVDRKHDGLLLYNMLIQANYSVERVSYMGKVEGAHGYNLSSMKEIANNSKFVIYFSFWDTGAIALKEIQNIGVYTFSVQKDLIHDKTGLFVDELDGNVEKAFKIIDNHVKLNSKNIDTVEIARMNQYENSCARSLEDLCNVVYN